MKEDSKLQREVILKASGVNPKKCMKCGKCSATCPAFEKMEYHPHQFVAMVEKGNIEPLLKSESLYYCLTCFACVERCPRDVEPAKLVEAIRTVYIRQQGNNYLKEEDIGGVLDGEIPQQALMSAFRKYSK